MGQSHTRAFRNIEVYFPESDIRPRLVAMADPVSGRVATAVEDFGYERGEFENGARGTLESDRTMSVRRATWPSN